MQKIYIIGAGPAGLYAALKAKQAGLDHVTILDIREGHYTRPGSIVQSERGQGPLH